MRRFAVVVLTIAMFGSSLCLAQKSEQVDGCRAKAMTQLEMNVCANAEALLVDAELKDMAGKLQMLAAKVPNAGSKLTAVEKAWFAYRDAYIEAMYPEPNKQAAYGSSFSMKVNLLRAELTERHIQALRALLKQYEAAVP